MRGCRKSASDVEDAVRVKCLLAISYIDRDATDTPSEQRLAALQYMHATLDACLSAEQHEHRGTNALDVVRALGNSVNASEEKTARCVQCGTIALLERLLTDARSSEEEVLEALQCVEVLALTDTYKAQLRDSHKLMQGVHMPHVQFCDHCHCAAATVTCDDRSCKLLVRVQYEYDSSRTLFSCSLPQSPAAPFVRSMPLITPQVARLF